MVREILNESTAAIWGDRKLFALLFLIAVFALGIEKALQLIRGKKGPAFIYWVCLFGAAAGGIWLGWQEAFLCDDAYISFRYAKNFALGYGLVWNHGEWVEGYTNFLWTLGLGVIGKLGGDIPLAALFGCLAAFVIAIFATGRTVLRLSPKPIRLPFAAIALACTVPFQTFSTSGLETMPAAALVIVGLWVSNAKKYGLVLAGSALTAATLMRPDHALFWGCFGLSLAFEDLLHGKGKIWRRLRFRRYAAVAAPFLLIYVPYFLLRWRIYGDFYPNTYYAKNGDFAHWSQGAAYATHFVSASGAWAWLPLFFIAIIGRARSREETRGRIFAALSLFVFGRYVVRVGGDFMEYRFFIPLMPLVFSMTEVGIRHRLASPRVKAKGAPSVLFAAFAMAAATLPIHLIPPRAIKWSIAREPSFYHIRTVFPLIIDCPWETLGKNLATSVVSRGAAPPVAAAAIGMLGYHSGIPIIDVFGLINRSIAHKPFKREGRPGHEKEANTQELIAQGAVLDVGHRGDATFRDMTEARFGAAKLYFLRFDQLWVGVLSRLPGAQLPNPVRDAEVIAKSSPRERVLAAYTFYSRFLMGNLIREKVLARLDRRLAAVSDFEERFPQGTKVEGKGLKVARGARPPGASGEGWLSSLPDGKKGNIGKVAIAIEAIPANEIRFAMGGAASENVGVRLEVDGQVVFRATPNGKNDLSPYSFRLDDALIGKPGTFIIEDADAARNQGIFVDAIHFAAPEGDIRSRIVLLDKESFEQMGDLLQEARSILPPNDPERDAMESKVLVRYSLDTLPEGTKVTGSGFGNGPESRPAPGQGVITGFEGSGFLNSYHGGDGSKGRVELPLMDIPSAPIVVMVGGGRACSKVYVGLEIAGKIVRRVCGKDDEGFRREVIQTRGYEGKRGRMVIVDDTDGPWGHILADEILVLKP